MDNFQGLSEPFKSIGNLYCRSLQNDHSMASNVMQQKGLFSMPGKCKWYSENAVCWYGLYSDTNCTM